MSHYKRVEINETERKRLKTLGLDADDFSALESTEYFKTAYAKDSIDPGERGGLVNNRVMIVGHSWVAKGSVVRNSIINGDVLEDSYVSGVVCEEASLITDAKVITTNLLGVSKIHSSDVKESQMDASSIYDAVVENSTLSESTVSEGQLQHAKLTKSSSYRNVVNNSKIENSHVWDSSVKDGSYVNHGTINNALLSDVNLSHTAVVNAHLSGAELSESTIRNTKEVYSEIGENIFYDSELELSEVDAKFIERGWAMDHDNGRYDYKKGDDSIIITSEGVSTTLADYDRAAVIPLDMLDLVTEKAREIQQRDLTLSEDDLLDLEEGIEQNL